MLCLAKQRRTGSYEGDMLRVLLTYSIHTVTVHANVATGSTVYRISVRIYTSSLASNGPGLGAGSWGRSWTLKPVSYSII